MKKTILIGTILLALILMTSSVAAMNKAQLIEAIASDASLTKADAKSALEAFDSTTSESLKKGERVALVGFGSFSIAKRSARTSRTTGTEAVAGAKVLADGGRNIKVNKARSPRDRSMASGSEAGDNVGVLLRGVDKKGVIEVQGFEHTITVPTHRQTGATTGTDARLVEVRTYKELALEGGDKPDLEALQFRYRNVAKKYDYQVWNQPVKSRAIVAKQGKRAVLDIDEPEETIMKSQMNKAQLIDSIAKEAKRDSRKVFGMAGIMNKAELIEAIASDASLTKADAKRALDAFIGATSKSLKGGNRVALVGFGSFSIAKGRTITGDIPTESETAEVRFKAGDMPFLPNVKYTTTEDIVKMVAAGLDSSEPGEAKREGKKGLNAVNVKLAEQFMTSFTDVILKTVSMGIVVDLGEDFGTFWTPARGVAITGRHPQTGGTIQIPAKKVVKFKAGSDLSKTVA